MQILDEILNKATTEMEKLIDKEEDEKILRQLDYYMSQQKEEKYMLDSYMLVSKEKDKLQQNQEIFDFDNTYFQFGREKGPRTKVDRA